MKIHVLGLGETLKEYKPDGNKTIGCNDIWGRVEADYVVCVDKPKAFDTTPDRMAHIVAGRQSIFFSHIEEWKPLVKNFKLIGLAEHRSDMSEFDSKIVFSNNSPFVACVLAYKMGATEIITHGVDLVNHHKLGQDRILKHTLRDFKRLQLKFIQLGVEFKCSSRLSALADVIGVKD